MDIGDLLEALPEMNRAALCNSGRNVQQACTGRRA